eukprot:GHRR01010470.1.p1 GENE.GHRR01010470.1~~GHRR01010470.1.p1  ORF type:complete len:155 (+),score=33.37 GHRR01010470.1:124-588(+)
MGGARFVGRVVSNRMQKTVVVAVDYVVWQPKLKVYEKRTSKHFAHDEEQECNIGDTVRIKWIQRRSKHKSYIVEEILRKVNVYTPELGTAAAEAAAADSQDRLSRIKLADAQLEQATARLRKLKSMRKFYEQDIAQTATTGTSSSSSSHPASVS